jgi:uncharacterized membrane protein
MDLLATTTIRRPAAEVYDFWRRLENLPTFMAHLKEVRSTGDRTSHWTASAAFDRTVEWDAEITDEVPGERIGWRSTGDADVPNTGKVWFVPAPDGASPTQQGRGPAATSYGVRGGDRIGHYVT